MNPEEREELASLYVLGLLEGDELAAFERILATDPELVALVGELENASTILAMSVPQQRTPEALRDSVLSRIKQEDQTSVPLPAPQVLPEPARRPAFSFSWVPWAIAAGLTVASALFWNERSRLSTANGELEKENQLLSARVANLNEERARLETRLSTLESEKNELQIRVASLEARSSRSYSAGHAGGAARSPSWSGSDGCVGSASTGGVPSCCRPSQTRARQGLSALDHYSRSQAAPGCWTCLGRQKWRAL